MRKIGFGLTFLTLILFSSILFAQENDDRVLLNIAGEDITVDEFM